MDPKSDEGLFLGYSTSSKAYRVYNLRTKVMMESVNVVVDNTPEVRESISDEDDEVGISNAESTVSPVRQYATTSNTTSDTLSAEETNLDTNTPAQNKGPSTRIQKIHPQDNIIGSPSEGVIVPLEARVRKIHEGN